MHPVKTQISLGISPVWSESSLCIQWVAKGPSFLHEGSEVSDQTGRMPRLIWVFAGHTATLLVLSCCGSQFYTIYYNLRYDTKVKQFLKVNLIIIKHFVSSPHFVPDFQSAFDMHWCAGSPGAIINRHIKIFLNVQCIIKVKFTCFLIVYIVLLILL